MKRVLVEELKPGMKFNKPVYIDSSNILVGADVPIQENDIKRLMKWGIKEITTDGELVSTESSSSIKSMSQNELNKIIESYNNLVNLKNELLALHENACNTVLKLHTAIKNNRIFPTQDLNNVIESVINILNENPSIFIFINSIGAGKDPTAIHSVNTAFYSLLIGQAMKYTKVKMKELGLGAIMINAGMVLIPPYIVQKEGNLSEKEFNTVKTHPLLGYQALKNLGNFAESMALVSLQHHEQYDGNGYPRGLRGNNISEYARIVSIADNYEALLEKRSYREKSFFYTALKELIYNGARKFDPVILRLFVSILSVYPIGSIVQLNTKSLGLVIGSMQGKPMRPIVKLIKDESGNKVRELKILNLSSEPNLYVVRTIDEKDVGIKVSDLF